MSAETLAVLRTHASRELPLDSIRAIGSLALSGEAASNVYEIAGHVGTLVEFAGAMQSGAWSIPQEGMMAINDAARDEAVSTLKRAMDDLQSSGLSSTPGAGGWLTIVMQLLPLILELLKKR